jgi:hypothetical protein
MKILKPGFIVLTIIFFCYSCFFTKKSAKEEKQGEAKEVKPVDAKNMTEIAFGWGGGFTGMVEEYHLLKDGTLKQGDEVKKKLDSKQLKAVMALFKKINFTKVKLNDPGNLYYFLSAKSANNEQKLTWNDLTVLPPEVKAAYDALINLTKQE